MVQPFAGRVERRQQIGRGMLANRGEPGEKGFLVARV